MFSHILVSPYRLKMTAFVGEYAGVYMMIAVDATVEYSQVSGEWLRRHKYLEDVLVWYTEQGLVIPGQQGEYVSVMPFVVVDRIEGGMDILLGRDWVSEANPEIHDGIIKRPARP